MKSKIIVAVIALAAAAAQAQHAPYAGQKNRAIKALSADEVKQYLAGAGMGHARAAELNHYPGPMHVLELADKLNLSSRQRENTKRLMDAHKAEARAIGARLVDAERALDRLFASGKVTEAALAEHVRTVARLQGEYRLSHLETHRRMRDMLTDGQVRRYDELRGYGGEGHGPAHGAHH
jgi:ABC-type sugar transport system substrate-binding protein